MTQGGEGSQNRPVARVRSHSKEPVGTLPRNWVIQQPRIASIVFGMVLAEAITSEATRNIPNRRKAIDKFLVTISIVKVAGQGQRLQVVAR